MKQIVVLTYPVKHRKTYDVLTLLKANGYNNVFVYATPFSYTKKREPYIKHRPQINYSIPDIKELCQNLGYTYSEGPIEDLSISEDSIVLVAGAGILPEQFIENHLVINSHPGYIPNCRGLDSLKWAVHNMEPIGVTSHIIGKDIDAGDVIERRLIRIEESDTFHALAERVYENEISMLVEAIIKLEKGTVYVAPSDYEVHKRMPLELETGLFDDFEQYKKSYFSGEICGCNLEI